MADGNSQWNGKFGDDEMKRRAAYGNGSFTGTNSQWGTSPSGDTFQPRAAGRQLQPASPINVAGAR